MNVISWFNFEVCLLVLYGLGLDNKNSGWSFSRFAIQIMEFEGISVIHGRYKLLQSF